jgi:hypothetical protein
MTNKQPTTADAIRELMTAEDASGGPHPDFADLVAHHLGRISGQEAKRIQAHVDHCVPCAAQLLELTQWETDESHPASDEEVEEVWARLEADPRFLAARSEAASPPFLWWHEPLPLQWLSAGLLITTLVLSTAWIFTLVKVGRLQSGEVNVPVATISKEVKRQTPTGTAKEGIEVLPGTVLIVTPPDMPEGAHEVQITRQDGHVVWTGQGLWPSPKGSFHLRLPRDLAPGTYRLRIVPGKGQEILVRVTAPEPG